MAGLGSRLQPIGFSKELYPVAYKNRHYAISEFSVRAMIRAQVDEIKLVINPDKTDLVKYYSKYDAPIGMYLFKSPSLPESCLYPLFSLSDEDIIMCGLPDTIFAPADGYVQVKKSVEAGADISLGLFKVADGSKFDSVKLDKKGKVKGVKVKQSPPLSDWIWGIWAARVKTARKLAKIIYYQNQKSGEKLLGLGFDKLAQQKGVMMTGIKLSHDYFDVGDMEAVVRANQVINKKFEF